MVPSWNNSQSGVSALYVLTLWVDTDGVKRPVGSTRSPTLSSPPKQNQASCIMDAFPRTKLFNFPPGPPGARLPVLKCGSGYLSEPAELCGVLVDCPPTDQKKKEPHFTVSIPIALGDEDV